MGLLRRCATVVAALPLAATAACSRYTPSYDQDGNVNGGLVSEMHTFADNLAHGRGAEIILTETVPGFMPHMGRFLEGHLGYPARVVHIGAVGDQVAAERLAITCRPGDIQQVQIVWRWQDGGWRGWPGFAQRPDGRFASYRPCDN